VSYDPQSFLFRLQGLQLLVEFLGLVHLPFLARLLDALECFTDACVQTRQLLFKLNFRSVWNLVFELLSGELFVSLSNPSGTSVSVIWQKKKKKEAAHFISNWLMIRDDVATNSSS